MTPVDIPRPAPAPSPPALTTAWPRPAQLAAAFLLGAAIALVGVRLWGGGPPKPLDRLVGTVPTHVIDVHRASSAELLQLPGVGPTLAGRMAAERDTIRSTDDLRSVPGIGPARLERLRPWVRADGDAAGGLGMPRVLGPATVKKAEALKEPIDLNRATADELQKLPGIGPKLAQRILDERAKGPFHSVDELRRVSGIGPKTLDKLRPFVMIGSQNAPTDFPGAKPHG